MDDVKKITAKIKKALMKQCTYSKDMDICIDVCAGNYRSFLLAMKDVNGLESTCIEESTREKHIRIVPHPAFKVLQSTGESTRKALRELGLTITTIAGADNDEVSDLIEDVNNE